MVRSYDEQLGELELTGEVRCRLSATHLKVRLDSGLQVAARIADCTVIDSERSAA
jgi:translation initiation factor IF-1